MQQITISEATTLEQFKAANTLISKYMYFLDEDLSFQKIDDELATLSTMYGGKNGCLLLAENNGVFVGMVALRRKSDIVCEMKRLFVLPSVYGSGIGKK